MVKMRILKLQMQHRKWLGRRKNNLQFPLVRYLFDSNYTRMLRAILNKSWRQHPTKQQLHGHLPPITKTIRVRRTRYAGHCWRSGDELISDVLLWTPSHGRAKARRPAQTYIQQLCEDTGCSLEDLPEAMNDREEWRERARDIRAGGTTWWCWWFVSCFMPHSWFGQLFQRSRWYRKTLWRINWNIKEIFLLWRNAEILYTKRIKST